MAEAYSSQGRTAYKYQFSALPGTHASDLHAYFGPLSSVPYLSEELQRAFMTFWGNFITEANPSPPYVITGRPLANTMGESNATASWPAFSIASPNQLNLNQTGGAAAVGAMDVYSPVHTTYFTGPELKTTYSLDNAYTWEEGRGDRCDLWRSLAPLVPM
jgi:hypothetical protein